VEQKSRGLHLLGAHDHETGFAFVGPDGFDIKDAPLNNQVVGGRQLTEFCIWRRKLCLTAQRTARTRLLVVWPCTLSFCPV